jgi:hypothetical protein
MENHQGPLRRENLGKIDTDCDGVAYLEDLGIQHSALHSCDGGAHQR